MPCRDVLMDLRGRIASQVEAQECSLVVGLWGMMRFRPGRLLAIGLALGASSAGASAQISTSRAVQLQRQERRTHRETNASRQARIQRTIEATYAHPWEVFGGGGFLRWSTGDYTQKSNQVSWVAGTSYFLNPKLSILGNAQGSFGHGRPLRFNPEAAPIGNPQINEYFFTGGVNYRFYAKQKLALSAQGTGGVAWGIFSSGSAYSYSASQVGFWNDGIRPAFTVSVSADYNIYPNLAFRVAPTYVGSTFGGTVQNNLGLNAGIVYRFGSRK